MTTLPARFANRTGRRQLATAVATGLGVSSPPYVSIKGGSFTLIDEHGDQEEVETKYLDCVIFDVSAEVPLQRVYWGQNKQYNPNSDSYEPPVCFSDNGIGASRNSQEPQSPSCQACQWSTWGSATSKVTGKGVPACHVIKKVAVIVPGWDFPFLLRVPVTSHDNLKTYSDKFRGQEFDVSEVVTRIAFVHGAVGQLEFQATGFTDDETENLIEQLLRDKRTDALIGRHDIPVQNTLSAPKPATQIEQKSQPEPQREAPQQSQAPFGDQQAPAKRGRKKAEPTPPAAQGAPDEGIPPFLRRAQPAAPNGPASGIVLNPPPPNADLEASLANVFGLKT